MNCINALKPWGYHLILDIKNCNPYAIRSKFHIENFAKSLVQKIEMVPFGEPQVQHFGSGNKSGYTLVQLIETSNITGHFCDETGDAYIDIFSCKLFSTFEAKECIMTHFAPERIHEVFLFRDAQLK